MSEKIYTYPTGKALFVHMIRTYSKEASNVQMKAGDGPIWDTNADCAAALVEMGFSEVWVKISDGTHRYNLQHGTWRDVIMVPFVKAMKDAGLRVWGWSWFYGAYPRQEADIAISQVIRLGLDGYIINAEVDLKKKRNEAKAIGKYLRDGLPKGMKMGLSSYRYPELHGDFPWIEFLQYCDFNAPQVYWEGAHNPAEQLAESIKQNKALRDIPIYPTGSAYTNKGWIPTPEDLDEFNQAVRDLGIPSISWWEGWHAWRLGLLDVIGKHDWKTKPADPVVQPGEGENQDVDDLTARVVALEGAVGRIQAQLRGRFPN